MKKHIKTILGIIFALLLCGTAFAQTKANPESDFKLIIPELELGDPYYVYVGKSENVVIPKKEFYSDKLFRTAHTTVKVKSVVIPKGVTKIGDKAFSNCSSIEKISIPSTVTSIGEQAFIWCSQLKEIKIPNSVKSIGRYAFWGCSSLTKISIPPSVNSIGKCAFNNGIQTLIFSSEIVDLRFTDSNNEVYSNTSLKNVILLEGVKTIGNYAFERCESLTSVKIPSTVEEIGEYAFIGCESLVSVTIPEGVTTIKEHTFSNCHSLTTVTIPSTVTEIEFRAFEDCQNLTEISIPPSVTGIGSCAFQGCGSLKEISIPPSVTGIGSYAFQGCQNLTEISIPPSVTGIGGGAFQGCGSLKEISIPPSVTFIGDGAFGDSGISKIIISNDEQLSHTHTLFDAYDYDVYRWKSNTSLENVIFLEGVTTIRNRNLSYCKALTSVTIPSTVKEIEGQAFTGCESLVSVTIPEGVTYIGRETFKNCKSLTSVTIPSTVKEIESSAFEGCESLVSVTIPEGVTYIGGETFKNCKSLTSVTIPEGVTHIYDGTFANCKSLTSVIIPSTVKEIGESAFAECSALKNITFPKKLRSIGQLAFSNCTSLETITIPPIEKIGYRAFGHCSSLSNVNYLDNNAYFLNESDSNSPFDECNISVFNVVWDYAEELEKRIKYYCHATQVNFNYRLPNKENPFEDSANFTPHITNGKMDIRIEFINSDGRLDHVLCIEGNTGAQNKDHSDCWEAACILNPQMKKFIQKGDNIAFKAIGDGYDWIIHFTLYADDKPIYYSYQFSTKKDKVMTVRIPYKKLKPANNSVKRKFNKNEVCDIIISGNNAGQETNRSLKIYNVRVY
jgi:hypothetical protein